MDSVQPNQNQKILKNFFIIILGSLVLTISAKIKIPFYPVPMTMQTFVVLFLGIAFGYKIGLSIITVYLFEGILGLPVFSNSPEKGVGLVYFTGPTMGYLIGFLSAVFLTGYFNFGKNIIQNSNSNSRVVMLTGYGNIPTAVAAIKQGAIDYLAKPADADDVEKALLANPNKKAEPPENPMSADRVKWEHIHRVFELCNRNVSETARRLKMHRRTLQRILSKRSPR